MKCDIRNLFADWVEPDVSLYYLACLLGIMELDQTQEGWIRVMPVFNTNNVVSRALYGLLEQAVGCQMLERNDLDQYRWNSDFENQSYWKKYINGKNK
jgi:hypothetical protein